MLPLHHLRGRRLILLREWCLWSTSFVLLVMLISCGSSGPEDPKQAELRALLQDLSAEAGPDRRRAAMQLEKILPPANQAQGLAADVIKNLRAMVADDRDDHVRAAAIRTLGGTKDKDSWKVIAERASNEEAQVRSEVIQALYRIDPEKARPLIQAALQDKEASVQQIAASILVQDPIGIETIIGHLDEKSPFFSLALTVLSSSPSPGAQKALLAGLTSSHAEYLKEAIRAAGKLKYQAAIPQVTALLSKTDTRKVKVNQDLVRVAASTLSCLGGKDAFIALLALYSKENQDWMDPLLEPHKESLRSVVLEQAAVGSQRVVPKNILINFLLTSPQASEFPVLAQLAQPEEPQILDLCKALQGASPEIRAPIAARLREALQQGIESKKISLSILGSLGYVGQVKQGPDVDCVVKSFLQLHEEAKKDQTNQGIKALRREFGFACLRLQAPGLDAVYTELLNDPQGVDPVGLKGVLQAGNIEAVNQTLLRIGTSASAPHLWHLVTDMNATLLGNCHDPRLVPGLASLFIRKHEQSKVCDLLLRNGTREAAHVLMDKLRDPEVSVSFKRDVLYPIMPQFGAAGRPLYLASMLQEPQPKKHGDPDLGWWCADFLRAQADDAVADLLAAITEVKPKTYVAARCIRALELASSAPAVGALVAWLSDPDQELTNLALNALVRQQRTSIVPTLKNLRDKTSEGPWRNRLDLAISTLTPVTK